MVLIGVDDGVDLLIAGRHERIIEPHLATATGGIVGIARRDGLIPERFAQEVVGRLLVGRNATGSECRIAQGGAADRDEPQPTSASPCPTLETRGFPAEPRTGNDRVGRQPALARNLSQRIHVAELARVLRVCLDRLEAGLDADALGERGEEDCLIVAVPGSRLERDARGLDELDADGIAHVGDVVADELEDRARHQREVVAVDTTNE